MSTVMRSFLLAAVAFVAAGLMASCVATESVTIDASAFARATAAVPSPTPEPVPADAAVDEPDEPDEPIATAEPVAEPDSAPTPTAELEAEPAEDPTEEPTAEEPTTESVVTPGGLDGTSCAFSAVDNFGDMQFELAFESPTTELIAVTVKYTIYDPDGQELDSKTEFLEVIAPGEQLRVIADSLEDLPSGVDGDSFTCAITAIDVFGFAPDGFEPTANDTCRFLRVDSFGDIQVELVVTSPLDVEETFNVTYVMRGADGVRFGDGTKFFRDVGAGATVTEESDTLTELPAGTSASELSCEIVLIESFG